MTRKILVRHITHLTDARYFAAMGVDWMSIELNEDPKSFMLWHALRDWVEGVKLLAEVNTNDDEVLARVIIDARPDGLLVGSNVKMDIPSDIEIFKTGLAADDQANMIWSADAEEILSGHEALFFLKNGNHTDRCFLECEWTMALINNVMESGYEGGFCFYGGKEQVTGVRDYSEIDEMIERIKEEKAQ